MGVTAREHPKGSGRWVVFVSKGKFRYNQVIKEGEERAKEVAEKTSVVLDTMGVRAALNMLCGKDQEQWNAPTISEYAKKWSVTLSKSDLKRSTKTSYQSNLDNHIVPHLGKLVLTEIDYRALKEFFEGLGGQTYSTGRFRKEKNISRRYSKKPAEQRKYSRDTIRLVAMTLRAMLTEAVHDKYITTNPVEGLSKYYRRRKKDREVKRSEVYTLEQLYAIEDVLRARRKIFGDDYEFSLLMSRTGMRIGEAIAIQPADVDMQEKTIQIERNIPTGIGELEDSAKTHNSERTVDMGEDLYLALRDLQARRRQESLQAGRPKHSEWLFHNQEGDHYDYKAFWERWNRAQELAGVRQRSPHCLRHTYASLQLEAGVNIADVSKQLGHANPAITYSIYVHFVPKKHGSIRNALDRNPNLESDSRQGKLP